MEKLEKLLEFVIKEEDRYYDLSHKAMEKENTTGMLVHQAEAVAYRKIRYIIEDLINA